MIKWPWKDERKRGGNRQMANLGKKAASERVDDVDMALDRVDSVS